MPFLCTAIACLWGVDGASWEGRLGFHDLVALVDLLVELYGFSKTLELRLEGAKYNFSCALCDMDNKGLVRFWQTFDYRGDNETVTNSFYSVFQGCNGFSALIM